MEVALYFQASVGVNIEGNRISLVCLKAGLKGPVLAAQGVYPLAEGGPEQRAARIRERVEEFLREHRIPSADIFLGIPRELAILRYVELPAAVKENLRGTLAYEMGKYIPLPGEEVYFDQQIVAEDREAGTLSVLLVAVKKESVDPYLDPEQPLGAGVSGIEIASTALANCVSFQRPEQNGGGAVVIVSAGGERIEVGLLDRGLLRYSRSAGRAEQGAPPHGRILEELDLLRGAFGGDRGPLPVVLCGSETDGIAELFRERADFELRSPGIPAGASRPDCLAPAYGLALKGFRKVAMNINLVPPARRKKVSKIGYYAMFVLAGLFVLSVLAWGASAVLHQRRVADGLAAEIKRMGAEVAAINRTQAKLQEVQGRIDAINAIRQRHLPALNILQDLSKEIPAGAWIDRFALTDKGGEIEGFAESAPALIPLMAASPLLKEVAFLSPITKGKDGKERFRIGFKLR